MRAGVPAPRSRLARRCRGGSYLPGPLAASCYYSYGLSLAYLGDAKGEITAFTRALAFTEGRGPRANLLYNRADARVAEGQLAEAIDDYRNAIALANHPEITALAYYGLAVALDRYGDLPAAWVALESAHRVAPPFSGLPGADILDAPSVFFVPAYEKDYYRALSLMALARAADSAAERRELLAARPRALGSLHRGSGKSGRPLPRERAAARVRVPARARTKAALIRAAARKMRFTPSASSTASNTGRRCGPRSISPNAPLAASARARGPSSTMNTS